jgi:trehalose 6-phosphate synthase/phosphatase
MKIINISYRLPISFSSEGEETIIKTSSGGLVSAIQSLRTEENDLHWVGIADFSRVEWVQNKSKYEGDFVLHPIFLETNINSNFYNGFSNSVLWPLFHYFPSFVEYKQVYYDDYIKANQIIAEEIRHIIANDDVIWIHDYHLMPLASFIRQYIPKAKIGFFLHIPFPTYELIRLLPKHSRDTLIKNLLEADLIGFHTFDYVQHFLNTVQMIEGVQHKQFILHYKERVIKVGAYPISIDFQKFNNAFQDINVFQERKKLRELYVDKKIIFSVDRLDYTKGIIFRLKGYAKFLENNPEWKEKIVFLLVAVPSRDSIHKYSERKQMIENLISQINGKFGNIKWTPIVYQYHSVNFTELLGLYTSCDLALISPLRDGMNLVAKEFVASRQDQKGVLLLSDMTGAAKELTDALLFNPLDEEEISEKIKEALSMNSQEQIRRMENLQAQIRKNNVFKWGEDFINDLQKITENRKTTSLLSFEPKSLLLEKYQKAQKRLILLDYDGTLSEFQTHPDLAKPNQSILDILIKLSRNTLNNLVIISGRERSALEEWLGHLPITLIAEHGIFIKRQQGWENVIKDKIYWKSGVRKIMQFFAENCYGSFVEEKSYSISWHYRNTLPESGFAQSRELISILSDYLISTNANIIDGNKVIEVKPVQVNKGSALIEAFNIEGYDFILSIGDDKTDEDMFEVINQYDNSFTIKVGNATSIAKYRLMTVQQVMSLLEQLT